MNAAELLARCRAAGVALTAGEDGALLWEADADPPADLLADLVNNKVAVRQLLPRPDVPPWDAAVADALLAELRAEVTHVVEAFGGYPPAPLAALLADAITIGERFVRDRDAEAARGWNALALLADLPPLVRDCLRNWEAMHGDRKRPTGNAFIELCPHSAEDLAR